MMHVSTASVIGVTSHRTAHIHVSLKLFCFILFLVFHFIFFFFFCQSCKFDHHHINGIQYPDRQDNVDIAASIKALAQSVHGEAIFGDLPKPRFSTEI